MKSIFSKHIIVRIIKSLPLNCVNRDESGMPKTMQVGGVERIRISQQCCDRAIRLYMQEQLGFGVKRTKRVLATIREIAKRHECGDEMALAYAIIVANHFGIDTKSKEKVTTLQFHSPQQWENAFLTLRKAISLNDKQSKDICATFEALGAKKGKPGKDDGTESPAEQNAVEEADGQSDDGSKKKQKKSELEKAFERCKICPKDVKKAIDAGLDKPVSDAWTQAVFGMMVPSDKERSVESIRMGSHAFTTHAASTDWDWFSAMDDCEEGTGAGHLSTNYFSSGCFYRLFVIDLGQLERNENLFDSAQRKKLLAALIKAVVLAHPSARQNTMFSNSPADYVMLELGEGQAIDRASGAFDTPVQPEENGGYVAPSIAALRRRIKSVEEKLCLPAPIVRNEVVLSEEGGKNLDEAIEEVLSSIE